MRENEVLRVLVVDDESPARRDIKRMLKKIVGVETVGEGRDGIEAVELIRELRPDLVLLDIQMPGLDGFQVLARLAGLRDFPSVIFITAYDQYALKAFDVHAVDYILKPVDEERLVEAIGRVRRVRKGLEGNPDLEALLQTIGALPKRIAVRCADSLVMVDADDILYATISSGEVRVVAREIEGTARQRSLDELQRELSPGRFMRVHRSYLANLRQIHEITPHFSGSYRLRMGGKGGPVVPLSRGQAKELKKVLKW
ncbi:MAG: response regulator transcription factor [Candidatus Krumholzibacteria bacterium]|nr:response regulator transcription factor [Candidatus Krumholzibacteria bacterium]